jgi:hypothetical protein
MCRKFGDVSNPRHIPKVYDCTLEFNRYQIFREWTLGTEHAEALEQSFLGVSYLWLSRRLDECGAAYLLSFKPG